MKKSACLIACLAMVGCTKGTLMHRYETVSRQGWERTDTLCYEVPAVATGGEYAVSLGMRYGNDFPYEGIWIVAEGRMENPEARWCDTLYLRMADDRGTPLGHGVALMQESVPLRQVLLAAGQHGKVRVWHIMHREVMPWIREVGIKFERTDCDRHPYAER